MTVNTHSDSLPSPDVPVCAAMGFFDGVHRGHVHVLDAALAKARALGGDAWMFTFEPHPSQVLRPQDAPNLLMSTPQKFAYARAAGMKGGLALPFNRQVAQQSPEAFIQALHERVPALASVAVGSQWRFGHKRSGSVDTLHRLGSERGFTAEGVDAIEHAGAPISSTRIREAITSGALEDAEDMQGRPVSLRGDVIGGQKLGRTLGYPTANLSIATGVFPPYGIYAARAAFQGMVRDGVVSYGERPTVAGAGAEPVLEIHLFDFDEDVYGVEMEVYLHESIRPETAFPDLDALRAQIRVDCTSARTVLDAKKAKDYLYIHM